MEAKHALAKTVVLLLLPAITGCGEDRRTGLPRGVCQTIENADTVVIYAIEPPCNSAIKEGELPPESTSERLHKYPIYGSVQVKNEADRKAIVEQLYMGLERGKEIRYPTLCILPRHAIRATYRDSTVDVLLCFECEKLEVRAYPIT